MPLGANEIEALGEGSGAERRIHGRRRQQMLVCDLGPVLDLSLGGMRVATKRPRQGQCEVTLMTDDGPLTVNAMVAWSKRVGFLRHEIGLRFKDVDAETSKRLTQVSSKYQYFYGHVA